MVEVNLEEASLGAGFYAPWIIVGWIFGYLPWLLLAATVLQLAWHLHYQMRLSAWLWDEKRLTPLQVLETGSLCLTVSIVCSRDSVVSAKN